MPSSEPKLPPLKFNDEIKEYEAYEEKTEVAFKKCPHHDTSVVDGWLKCKCGAGWQSDINTLQRLQKTLREH